MAASTGIAPESFRSASFSRRAPSLSGFTCHVSISHWVSRRVLICMKEQILKLRAEGKSFREIQKILGCSSSTVWYHASPKYKTERIEKIKKDVVDFRAQTKLAIVKSCGGKCACCDYDKHQHTFDWHHLNPKEKEYDISYILHRRRSMDTFVTELKKCIMVCANCHREIHAGVRDCPNTSNFNETLFRELVGHDGYAPSSFDYQSNALLLS